MSLTVLYSLSPVRCYQRLAHVSLFSALIPLYLDVEDTMLVREMLLMESAKL